jgi:lysozyme family protein
MPDLTNEQAQSKAFAFASRWEGGYVNDPNDRGGATNLGVTQSVYNQYRQEQGQPVQTVRNITKEEAKNIYIHGYWNKVQGDRLPTLTAISLADFAYNSGPTRAIHEMKRFLRDNGYDIPMTADGKAVRNEKLDSETIAAVEDYTSKHGDESLAQGLNSERRQFVQRIVDNNPSQGAFLKGWNNRINSLEEYMRDLNSEKVQTVQNVTEASLKPVQTSELSAPSSKPSKESQIFAQASQMILDKRGHLEGDTQVYRGYTYSFQKQADTLITQKHGQEIFKQVGREVLTDRVTPVDMKVLHAVTQNLEKSEHLAKDFAKDAQLILDKRGHMENGTQVFRGNTYTFEKHGDTLTVQKNQQEIFKQVGDRVVHTQVTQQDLGILDNVAQALEQKGSNTPEANQPKTPVGTSLER